MKHADILKAQPEGQVDSAERELMQEWNRLKRAGRELKTRNPNALVTLGMALERLYPTKKGGGI